MPPSDLGWDLVLQLVLGWGCPRSQASAVPLGLLQPLAQLCLLLRALGEAKADSGT